MYLDTFGDFGGKLQKAVAEHPVQLRIGVTTSGVAATRMAPLDPAVREAVHRTADILAGLGHVVRDVDVKYGLAARTLTARYLGGIRQSAGEVDEPVLLQRNTRGMAALGRAFPLQVIRAATRAGHRWGDSVHDQLDVDVLLTPVMTGVAPKIGAFAGRNGLQTVLAMNAFYPFTAQWNHAGLPAVSLPAGVDEGGRPLAIQLIGRRHGDATLMALAAQAESAALAMIQ